MSKEKRLARAGFAWRCRTVALVLVGSISAGCSGGSLQLSEGERVESFGDPLRGSYVESGRHAYASVLAVQTGWNGWKERHLSSDGLLSVQLVLRCPPIDAPHTYSVPDECQGFLFLAESRPIESWPLSRGIVILRRVDGVIELSGELQLGETDPTLVSRPTELGSTASLAVHKARLSQNADTLREIQASGNLETAPKLRMWAKESDGQ